MQQSPCSGIISTRDNVADQQQSNGIITSNESLQYLVSSLTPPRYLTSGFIKVNVLDVCENGAQQVYFNLGLDRLKESNPTIYRTLNIEHRKNKTSKASRLDPSDITEWLIDSDIHFILSHVHQGMLLQHHHDWTVDNIESQLSRLMNHRGFPLGQNLRCPIFLQDKWRYLDAIKMLTLDTLKVPIPVDLEDSAVIDRISE